ncbi:MAG TPA: hypothetical protein PK537_09545 [Candidatus Limiplasma sp.]|nr:hypothetical protein [Candidatus Limiplasma sp.]
MRNHTLSGQGSPGYINRPGKPIRAVCTGLRNITAWLPILWKDRPWDAYYLYVILKKKLECMSRYEKEYAIANKAPAVARDMDRAIALIDRLINRDATEDDPFDRQAPQTPCANTEQAAQDELFDLLKTHIGDWWD